MYVCLCKGVTDKQIKRAVQQSTVSSMRDLKQHYGVGGQCGRCTCAARDLVNQALQEQAGAAETTVVTPAPGFTPQLNPGFAAG